MISVKDVSKDFGRRRVLDRVSFDVLRGEVVGLLGPNGAGKTTVIRILTGFFPPTEGKVTLDEVDLSKRPKQLKRKIGYLPERLSIYPDLQVEEFLRFVARIKQVPAKRRRSEVLEKISACGLESVRTRLVGHLSKGFLQRVGLAQALIGNPDVLILDEPTNGLDPRQTVEIRELIRELGRDRTLILSTHILPEVSKVCERVLILNEGRIVAQGRPDELEDDLRERQEILVKIGLPSGGARLPHPFDSEGGETPPLQEILHGISGVKNVRQIEEKDRIFSYLLETLPNEDLRSEISKKIVQAGFPLLEITVRHLSLEEIFVKLVVSEQPAESR